MFYICDVSIDNKNYCLWWYKRFITHTLRHIGKSVSCCNLVPPNLRQVWKSIKSKADNAHALCVGFTRIIDGLGKSKDLVVQLGGKHHAFFVYVRYISNGAFIDNY